METTTPTRRNRLAYTSIALSFIFPFGVFCFLVGTHTISQPFLADPARLESVGILLTLLGIPSTVLATATAHAALQRANYPALERSARTVAVSVALSYVSLAFVLGVMGIVVWTLLFVSNFHIVY